jgi:hypothetical protein
VRGNPDRLLFRSCGGESRLGSAAGDGALTEPSKRQTDIQSDLQSKQPDLPPPSKRLQILVADQSTVLAVGREIVVYPELLQVM